MSYNRNQIRHDIINLHKTIKLLERTVNDEDWAHFIPSTQNAKWLKAQTVIGVRLALYSASLPTKLIT